MKTVIGDTKGFLELGVVINLFIDEDETVRFGVNTAAAKRAKLKIRARLLRLAKKFI